MAAASRFAVKHFESTQNDKERRCRRAFLRCQHRRRCGQCNGMLMESDGHHPVGIDVAVGHFCGVNTADAADNVMEC